MRFLTGIDAEEAEKIFAGQSRPIVSAGNSGERRDFSCATRGTKAGWFALAAVGHRREVRGIGLDQHPFERHAARDVLQRELRS
jgi:hypothetical protein